MKQIENRVIKGRPVYIYMIVAIVKENILCENRTRLFSPRITILVLLHLVALNGLDHSKTFTLQCTCRNIEEQTIYGNKATTITRKKILEHGKMMRVRR